jgi:hypothetical protein
LENRGAGTWSGTGNLLLVGSATLRNAQGATFEIQNDRTLGVNNSSTGATFINAGTLGKTGGAGSTLIANNITFNNTGTVDLQSGTLDVTGGGSVAGNFRVPAATTLNFAGGSYTGEAQLLGNVGTVRSASNVTLVGNGAIQNLITAGGSNTILRGNGSIVQLTVGGPLSIDGTYTVQQATSSNSLSIAQSATVSFDELTVNSLFSNASAVSIDTLTFAGGLVTGSGNLTVTDLTWTGGSMTGAGQTIVTGTLAISGNNNRDLGGGRVLENRGAGTWSGTGNLLLVGSATLRNAQGATLEVQNDRTLGVNNSSTGATFINAGTLRKTGGAGTTLIANNITFNNTGTVDAENGIVEISSVTPNSGQLIVRPAATLRYTSNQSFANSTVLTLELASTTQYGRLVVSGQAALDGTLRVRAVNGFTPSVNDTFQPVAYTTRSGQFTIDGGAITFGENYGPTSLTLTVQSVAQMALPAGSFLVQPSSPTSAPTPVVKTSRTTNAPPALPGTFNIAAPPRVFPRVVTDSGISSSPSRRQETLIDRLNRLTAIDELMADWPTSPAPT